MEEVQTKRCPRCGDVKFLTEFRRKSAKSGKTRLQSYCVMCMVAYQVEYSQINKEKINISKKIYLSNHLEERKVWYRRWASSKVRRATMMVLRAKERAKVKGLPFDITIEDFVMPDRCPALGVALDYEFKNSGKFAPNSPSLDRRIPELGYVKGNVQVISSKANWIKSDATPDGLMKVALYSGMMS